MKGKKSRVRGMSMENKSKEILFWGGFSVQMFMVENKRGESKRDFGKVGSTKRAVKLTEGVTV